jgi:hypothetical protein
MVICRELGECRGEAHLFDDPGAVLSYQGEQKQAIDSFRDGY